MMVYYFASHEGWGYCAIPFAILILYAENSHQYICYWRHADIMDILSHNFTKMVIGIFSKWEILHVGEIRHQTSTSPCNCHSYDVLLSNLRDGNLSLYLAAKGTIEQICHSQSWTESRKVSPIQQPRTKTRMIEIRINVTASQPWVQSCEKNPKPPRQSPPIPLMMSWSKLSSSS